MRKLTPHQREYKTRRDERICQLTWELGRELGWPLPYFDESVAVWTIHLILSWAGRREA